MPAYAAPSVGSWVSSSVGGPLSVVAPASATGKLLLLVTAFRAGTASITSLEPHYQQLAAYTTNGSIEVWGRIGDDTANDDQTVQWGGSNWAHAVILAYGGDVHTELSTLVAHSATEGSSGSSSLNLPTVSGVTTDDCLVFAVGRKSKTTVSNDATDVSHASLTMRAEIVQAGVSQAIGIADLQQTTAANFDGTNMTINGTAESLAANGLVLYLRTATAGGSAYVLPTMFQRMNTLTRL